MPLYCHSEVKLNLKHTINAVRTILEKVENLKRGSLLGDECLIKENEFVGLLVKLSDGMINETAD